MKFKTKSFTFGPVGMVLALCFLVNCQRAAMESQLPQGQIQSPESLQENVSNPMTNQAVCRPAMVKSSKAVKVLFVVDGSGSNFGEFNTVPSDPGKKWRSRTLRQFLSQYTEKENFYFGLTLFKGKTSKSLLTGDGFSNEKPVVQKAYRSFLRFVDGGNTPYKAALVKAKDLIAADLRNNASDLASYAVVMISDGRATDYQRAHDVIPEASAIKDLAPDRITLNSVYYSARVVDASAPQYLKSIAEIGEGEFVVANTQERLNLEEVIRIAARSCQ